MKCPIDESQLAITERQGVEIDYCPQCRGVWLDRGELDKIIEKSESMQAPAADNRRPDTDRYYREERDNHKKDDYKYKDGYGHKKKKRESFLSDMFDF